MYVHLLTCHFSYRIYIICNHSPFQVSHFFLGPELHKFARVALAESVLEAIVVFDVAVPVLEFVKCGLEDLDGTFTWNHKLL